MQKKSGGILKLWAVAFWLLVWQLAAMAIDQKIFLVTPWAVLTELWQLLQTNAFYCSILFSLIRIVGGFFLGTVTGVILAALSVRYHRIAELIAPLLLTVKSVPVASFIILALLWFSSQSLAILISFLIVLPVIYTNTVAGIRATDQKLLEMAQVFSIPVGRKLRYLYIPQVAPYFLSGCSTAVGLSWKSGIAAEVIGIPDGSIGAQLQQAKVYLDTRTLFAWTLVIVFLSIVCERLLVAILQWIAKRLERM